METVGLLLLLPEIADDVTVTVIPVYIHHRGRDGPRRFQTVPAVLADYHFERGDGPAVHDGHGVRLLLAADRVDLLHQRYAVGKRYVIKITAGRRRSYVVNFHPTVGKEGEIAAVAVFLAAAGGGGRVLTFTSELH